MQFSCSVVLHFKSFINWTIFEFLFRERLLSVNFDCTVLFETALDFRKQQISTCDETSLSWEIFVFRRGTLIYAAWWIPTNPSTSHTSKMDRLLKRFFIYSLFAPPTLEIFRTSKHAPAWESRFYRNLLYSRQSGYLFSFCNQRGSRFRKKLQNLRAFTRKKGRARTLLSPLYSSCSFFFFPLFLLLPGCRRNNRRRHS